MMAEKSVVRDYSRFLKGAFIIICSFTAVIAISSLIYLLLVGKINAASAVFSAAIIFFLIVLPLILSLRMPGSIGIFFLIIGSGVFVASLKLEASAKGKNFFVGASTALIISGILLILSLLAEKISRKGREG
ncbi:MAG: hypothetical protein N2440_06270 [Actinobacteria bacterium]|nr:hypothetical protein [Actinomycetota bacterium]